MISKSSSFEKKKSRLVFFPSGFSNYVSKIRGEVTPNYLEKIPLGIVNDFVENHWQISRLIKNINILVNKIYSISDAELVESACRTRQKLKIKNFLRASKKGFQESKSFNPSREEPPVVSWTHEQHWDLSKGKSTKRKNFSQQNI